MVGEEISYFCHLQNDTSIGAHDKIRLRVGTDYVLADKTLPAVA